MKAAVKSPFGARSAEGRGRQQRPPLRALAALAGVFVAGLFVAGFDQGHLFSLFQGAAAFDNLFLHELTHDMRHAAGMPCH